MLIRFRGFLRHAIYASRGGFLGRPFAIALALGLLGLLLATLEDRFPGIGRWLAAAPVPSHSDPQVAQGILVAIATLIARTTDDHETWSILAAHGRRIVEGCRSQLRCEDLGRLEACLQTMGAPPRPI